MSDSPATGSKALFILTLRVLMETGVVVAFATWGYHVGGDTATRVGLAILVPVVGFGFWGLVDFHQAGRWAEALRLIQELVVSGLAAAAWYAAGYRIPGVALGVISIVYHAVVYATGQRLLKPRSKV